MVSVSLKPFVLKLVNNLGELKKDEVGFLNFCVEDVEEPDSAIIKTYHQLLLWISYAFMLPTERTSIAMILVREYQTSKPN